jgi:hypothetical protein
MEWQLHAVVVTIIAVAIVALAPGLRRSIRARPDHERRPLLAESAA